jgi:L-lactate dehydrogenase complex protein LldF
MARGHPDAAARFVADGERARWHDQAVWWIRRKRDDATATVPDWEALRDAAAAIKAHALSRLADYLEDFERNATAAGAQVHWARDADEHNAIVHCILRDRGVKRLVKSKSMLTEECKLNPYLEARGIEVVDTDLGERIVQLAGEAPSHIVMPAIHRKKEEIGELFHLHLRTERGASDPTYLTEAARRHLRDKFLAAGAGLTGVNFAVAETAPSWCAPTRATPTWAHRCRRCTSRAWASRRSSRASATSACSCGCWRARRSPGRSAR